MNNRLALVGVLIATASVATPFVVAAQNPWRADPQANGQYMTPPAPQAAPEPLPEPLSQPLSQPYNMPKYAPLDGNVDGESRGYMIYPGGTGLPYVPGSVPNYGYGGPGYGGPGYGGPGGGGFGVPLGYGTSPYRGGLGYPGGYPGLGMPGSGWGGYGPNQGWGNNYGGPLSWMPFW